MVMYKMCSTSHLKLMWDIQEVEKFISCMKQTPNCGKLMHRHDSLIYYGSVYWNQILVHQDSINANPDKA